MVKSVGFSFFEAISHKEFATTGHLAENIEKGL